MAFVSECSDECAKAQLDLFSVPPTQTSIESSSYMDYHPVCALNENTTTIEFSIPGNGEKYVDLSNCFLYVKAKIVQTDGNDLQNDDETAPVNNLLHSMISQVDIYLDGKQITSSTNTYAYRALLETLLSYGSDAKKSQLRGAMYFKDQAGRMDSVAVDANSNEGFMKRRALAANSRTMEMIGRIHGDIFFQDRYLLNQVTMKIVLTLNTNDFCLMGADGRRLKILSAKMMVRKVKLSDSVAKAHAMAIQAAPAKYPIKRVVCKSFTVGAGLLDFTQESLFTGQLPSRLVIGLVDNRAFNGARNRNPFNFKHFNLREIGVALDGNESTSVRVLKPDFANNQFTEAYLSLFIGTNKINRDEGTDITPEDYQAGYALYVYDLSPDLCEGDNFNLIKTGTVRLSMKFSAALAAAISVIAYAEFENVIQITRERNVITDFDS